jgi:8-oxo-dGTP pyrophosphatase MutT (NUDIX family)
LVRVDLVPCCSYVDGICIKEGKILLVKRNCEPFKGFWHVVGGQVQDKETSKEALKREFLEETCLNVKIGAVLGRRIEQTFDRLKIIEVLNVDFFEGKVKLNYENTEFAWFAQFPSYSVYDYSTYLRK